jgi:hypothetical protein
VAIDSFGNIFTGETDNQRVRKIGADGIINTFAGDRTFRYSPDGSLAVVVTYGDLLLFPRKPNETWATVNESIAPNA